MCGPERIHIQWFLFWAAVVVFKELIFKCLCWEGVVGLKKFLLSFDFGEGVLFLKELIFNNFYFGRVWWS